MSTRSIIVVTGKPNYNGDDQTIRLYKHSDGYPTGNLPIIRDALTKAIDECNHQAKRWKEDAKSPIPEFMAALLIGESASVYGFGAKVDVYEDDSAIYYSKVTKETLGIQADLEWIYVIDLKNKTLKIYNGDQNNVIKDKTENPMSYVECLREECKSDEGKETLDLITSIEALGFKVNPSKAIKYKKPKSNVVKLKSVKNKGA